MATLYISEYDELPRDRNGDAIFIPQEPAITRQTVTYDTTSGESSVFNDSTRFIAVSASGSCWLEWSSSAGATATATTTGRPLASGTEIFVGVTPGYSVAAISS